MHAVSKVMQGFRIEMLNMESEYMYTTISAMLLIFIIFIYLLLLLLLLF
jgi:hypothetical protein